MAKASTFQDDFSTADPAKWNYQGLTNFEVVDGFLEATAQEAWASLDAVDSFDLTDSYFSIKVVEPLTGDATLYILFYEGAGYSDRVWFSTSASTEFGPSIGMSESVSDVVTGASIPHKTVRHRWLRLKEASGTLTWETSPDGETWVIRRSVPTPIDVSNVAIRIVCTDENGNTPALLDSVNLHSGDAYGIDEPIQMELLQDEFDTVSSGTWYNPEWETDVYTANVNAGRLELPVVANEYRYMNTADDWNLEGSHALWEVVQNANRGSSESGTITTQFTFTNGDDDRYEVRLHGGEATFEFYERIDAVDTKLSETGYSPAEHRWFRVREESGTIYLETSHNGAGWKVEYSGACDVDVAAIKMGMIVGSYEPETDPGSTLIDNLNRVNPALLASIGWYVGAGMPLGGKESGTVQQRAYFDDAHWLWDPIKDDPVLDPMSEQWVEVLSAGDHSIGLWDFANTIITPDQITPSTPKYQFQWLGPILHPEWWGVEDIPHNDWVPVPAGTEIPPGSDGHLCIMDPESGLVYSFWQASYDAGSDTWSATWGSITTLHGDGRDYVGSSTAVNLSRACGVMTYNNVAAGEIPHALFFTTDASSEEFRYPAQKSDGENWAGVENPVPQGVRVQLDPAIDLTAIEGITKGELMVGRALQRYGAYLGDSSGSRMGFQCQFVWDGFSGDYLETPTAYRLAGFLWDYWDLQKLPWDSLRVLVRWDGD